MALNTDPTEPVGKGDYIVRDDDCMSSISEDLGHFWETLWNHADNAELKEVRKDPNVLMPGDRVTIPPITPKQVSKATSATHRFRRKGVPAKLHLQLLKQGEPRANQSYRVDIDGKLTKGVTDANGIVDIYIPCKAKKGRLWVGPPEDEKMYTLQLGKTMPVERIQGVKQRLKNLGYRCGFIDDEITNVYRNGLRNFQKDNGLPDTGTADDATRQKLVEVHKS